MGKLSVQVRNEGWRHHHVFFSMAICPWSSQGRLQNRDREQGQELWARGKTIFECMGELNWMQALQKTCILEDDEKDKENYR